MITEVPVPTAETMPVEEPMVAAAVLLLLHVPPKVASVSVILLPTQIDGLAGDMTPGVGSTEVIAVAEQLPIV